MKKIVSLILVLVFALCAFAEEITEPETTVMYCQTQAGAKLHKAAKLDSKQIGVL